MSYTAAILTISDKGARGEREDKSGPVLCELAAEHGYQVFHPQLGVKTLLDGGRRRTKNLYGVVKRTVPAGQVRQ